MWKLCRPFEWKQTFVKSAAKLVLDKDLVLKAIDRQVRVELKVVSYVWKTFTARRKAKWKKRTEMKDEKRREDMEVIWEFKYRKLP